MRIPWTIYVTTKKVSRKIEIKRDTWVYDNTLFHGWNGIFQRKWNNIFFSQSFIHYAIENYVYILTRVGKRVNM